MEMEGFSNIITTLTLAKELHDIDRFDIVEQGFIDVLCWDSYYHNLVGCTASIFSGFYHNCDDCEETDVMVFSDDIISDYFIYAWEYGKLHKLSHEQNPYVIQAQNEVQRWLNVSHCVGWKLLSYTKTKKSARQSKLVVYVYISCGCNAQEHIAYGLIQLYSWFANKCTEFNETEHIADKVKEIVPDICTEPEYVEVLAA